MNEKYLYFRKGPALADDDDSANSCCFPLSSLAGMHPSDDDHLTLAFKSMVNHDGFTHGADEVVISDLVILTHAANNHRDVMQSLVDLFASNQKDGMLVIGDAVTGDFCNGLITAIDTITIDGINS
jgi:hypothetical protein|tara:strand:+ start:675 stop:1052 length:378 start_codon:yes stop_codon:yes gene_type:complete